MLLAGERKGFTVQMPLQKLGDKLVYLVYLDDSCEEATHQVIGAAIIHDREFLNIEGFLGVLIEEDIPEELRESFEFHASALFHGKEPFEKIERDKALSILKDCADMIADAPISVVYGAVDLRKLRSGIYATAQPIDIAFRLCIPEIEKWFAEKAPDELGILIADDTRNQHQKENLRKAFRANRSRIKIKTPSPTHAVEYRGLLQHIHDAMFFGDSKETVGIQVADLCCFLILRHLQGKADTEFLYRIIEGRIFSGKLG
jgi:hypothetical protein